MTSYPIDMAQRLRDSFDRATTDVKIEGVLWYQKVRRMAEELASKYDRPVFQVVGVIAALSPRNRFSRNMQDAESVLSQGDRAVVATFNGNKKKALRILETRSSIEVLDILNGDKVRAFYSNILLDQRDRQVTIDVWMMRLMGVDGTLTSRRYQDIAHTIRHVAREKGVSPKALQAITWVELRGAAY